VEEFLLDQSISATEMRAPPVALCVAAAMASFHFSELAAATGAAAGAAIVWPRLRAWARALAGLYSPAELAELRVAAVLSEARRACGRPWPRAPAAGRCPVAGFLGRVLWLGREGASAKGLPGKPPAGVPGKPSRTAGALAGTAARRPDGHAGPGAQVDALEAALSGGAAALLGFCHNDLQARPLNGCYCRRSCSRPLPLQPAPAHLA